MLAQIYDKGTKEYENIEIYNKGYQQAIKDLDSYKNKPISRMGFIHGVKSRIKFNQIKDKWL